MAWFSEYLPDVVRSFRGPENRELSKPDHLRFGTHGSLSVERKNGVWVFYDHEQCKGGGVIDYLASEGIVNGSALAWMESKFNARPPERIEFNRAERGGSIVYQYIDGDGVISLEVVRTMLESGKKTFRQRIPLESGGFDWSPAGKWRPIPYRLPELLAAPQSRLVFIVEGEKCADRLAEIGFLATTNAGGAKKFQPELLPFFADRHVVIIPDLDKAGIEHLADLREKLKNVAASIRVVSLPGLDGSRGNNDVADWLDRGHTADELREIVKTATGDTEIKPPPSKIRLEPWASIEETKIRWMVDGVIPARGFVALYGKPGSYKSFVALYLAAMIATGRDAFGKATEQAEIVYIMGEGGAGLRYRRDALALEYGLPENLSIHFIRAQLDLRSKEGDGKALVEAIREAGLSPKLVVIDTLARAFAGGNENASEDMGAFIAQTGAVQEALGCGILVVHHSGKDDARGMRGHSSLFGAVDAELEVTKESADDSPERFGSLTVSKQKDGEDGIAFGFRMKELQVSITQSSLVVEPIDAAIAQASRPEKRKRGRKADNPGLAYQALERALETGAERVTNNEIPRDLPVVSRSLWRNVYAAMSPKEGEPLRKAFEREVEALLKAGRIRIWTNYCWISDV